MLLPVILLDAKSDTTAGDPVPLNEFIQLLTLVTKKSSDLTNPAGDIPWVIEVSDSPAGPWAVFLNLSVAVASAGEMIVGTVSGAPLGGFLPWVRARLTDAPDTGSVSIKAFAKAL